MNSIIKISLFIIIAGLTLNSCGLLSAAGIVSNGQPTKDVPKDLSAKQETSVIIDHSDWSVLLQKHVTDAGWVDYKGFKNDVAELDKYLQKLASCEPTNDWSSQELLAFYINLYNAHTVKLILDNYPVKSIKDIKGAWTKPIVPVENRKLSLGGIENGVLRKMNEPRIHFAVNCASVSCPKLWNEAYEGSKIDEQLEMATKSFINSDKNEISKNDPKISSIFEWYKKDFKTDKTSGVIEYINQYSEVKMDPAATIQYKDYDWGLNEQK